MQDAHIQNHPKPTKAKSIDQLYHVVMTSDGHAKVPSTIEPTHIEISGREDVFQTLEPTLRERRTTPKKQLKNIKYIKIPVIWSHLL